MPLKALDLLHEALEIHEDKILESIPSQREKTLNRKIAIS
jgi:hypothetical protein